MIGHCTHYNSRAQTSRRLVGMICRQFSTCQHKGTISCSVILQHSKNWNAPPSPPPQQFHRHHHHHHHRKGALACFSTSSSSSSYDDDDNSTTTTKSTNTANFVSSMRNLVKPFFLKCHPDVHHGTDARDINLAAIQNLNAFLDSTERYFKLGRGLMNAAAASNNNNVVFVVDFMIVVPGRIKGRKQEDLLCRRKVELTLPKFQQQQQQQQQQQKVHIEKQLIKLLHVAGLKVPTAATMSLTSMTTTDVEEQQHDVSKKMTARQIYQAQQRIYEANRLSYVSRIDWKRYDQVYQETVQDIRASWVTDGLIRNDAQHRMSYIATLLSKMRIESTSTSSTTTATTTNNDNDTSSNNNANDKTDNHNDDDDSDSVVDPISQLIVLRRLSLLFDEHFDALALEDLGRLWENTTFVLTAPTVQSTGPDVGNRQQQQQQQQQPQQQYDTNRRRKKRETKGFSVTFHHDNSVTICIPVDFRDDDLLLQLKRHVKDYYHWMDLVGLEGIFPPSSSSSSSSSSTRTSKSNKRSSSSNKQSQN